MSSTDRSCLSEEKIVQPPAAMQVRSGTARVPLPGLPQGLVPWEYTLAELLRDAGYQSALYGKWHLGDREGRYPTNQGFDIHFNVREPSRGDVRNPGQQMLTSDTLKPNLPFVFDIENDPKEMWNLNGSSEWIAMAVARTVAKPYVASLKDHPHIKPRAAGPEEKDPIPSELPPMGPRSD